MDTVFGDVRFSKTAKNLLNQLRGGQIALEEFLKECAFWALQDGFDDLRPLPFPTAPRTKSFQEYDNLSPIQKDKVTPEFFTKNPEINIYYEQLAMVKNTNRSRYLWLKEIRGYLPQNDVVLLGKVDDRMKLFRVLVDVPEEVEAAQEVFGGEVVL